MEGAGASPLNDLYLAANTWCRVSVGVYRKGHSTETALGGIATCSVWQADGVQWSTRVLFCMLDMSTTFDCVDHSIQLFSSVQGFLEWPSNERSLQGPRKLPTRLSESNVRIWFPERISFKMTQKVGSHGAETTSSNSFRKRAPEAWNVLLQTVDSGKVGTTRDWCLLIVEPADQVDHLHCSRYDGVQLCKTL